MTQLKIQTRKKLLPLSIAVALGTFATGTYASTVIVNTSGSYTIGTGTEVLSASTSGTLDTAVDTETYLESSDNAFTVNFTSEASYLAAGNTNGAFIARASGSGASYDVTSSITYVDTIFNNSATAQNYTFDFNITRGNISVFGTPTAVGDFAYADYSIDILLTDSNNVTTSIFNSAAQLNMDDMGTITFSGDTTLGGTYGGGDFYGWGNYTGSLNLGTFNAGDSFTLTYGMTANARGQMTLGAGPGACIECAEGGGGTGGSGTRMGDPFAINGTGTTISSSPVSVPEASSVVLMGLGLAGLAATRRRRSKLNG